MDRLIAATKYIDPNAREKTFHLLEINTLAVKIYIENGLVLFILKSLFFKCFILYLLFILLFSCLLFYRKTDSCSCCAEESDENQQRCPFGCRGKEILPWERYYFIFISLSFIHFSWQHHKQAIECHQGDYRRREKESLNESKAKKNTVSPTKHVSPFSF